MERDGLVDIQRADPDTASGRGGGSVSAVLSRLGRPAALTIPDRTVPPPSWLGHVPFAFWIMDVLRPSLFVELGTHSGNSYSAFCQAVQDFGLTTLCRAVDTWTGDPQAGHYGADVHDELAAYHDPRFGDFSRLMRMTFDEAVGQFADGSIDLLHIDGLHSYEAVRHDYLTWLPKMSRRGVILFHDTDVRRDDFGVWQLWEEVAPTRPHFTFQHAHGLGVLGVGDELPADLQWLFNLQVENGEAAAQARTFFARLGDACRAGECDRALHALRMAKDDEIRHRDARIVDLCSKIWDRDYRLTNHASMVLDRDRVIADLTLAAQAPDDDHRAEVAGLNSRIGELDQALRAHIAMVQDRDRQILALVHSTSWRITAPVRALGRLAGLYRDTTHRMAMVPLEGHIGDHPALLLTSDQGRMPVGWCILSFTVPEASTTLLPVVYIDNGAGFTDDMALPLPPVSRGGWAEQLILLPPGTQALRLDPTIEPARFQLADVTIREIGKAQVLHRLWRRHGRDWRRELNAARTLGSAYALRHLRRIRPVNAYDRWVALYDTLYEADRAAIRTHMAMLTQRPLISVVMPVYNPPIAFLRQALDSVLGQLYPHWQLCIADDASTDMQVKDLLRDYASRDARIKLMFRDVNAGISAASNDALGLATGAFVALMDHDDLLPAHALYWVAVEINRLPKADVIYADEDKIDADNVRYGAYFKSDWNPDLLCGHNMISHLGVYRASLVRTIGGFRMGYEGSQDYDLALRATAATVPARIRHIPHILYHWRHFAGSNSFSSTELPRAVTAAHRAVQDHLDRTGAKAQVVPAPGVAFFARAVYALPDPPPLVTLIVPTRDRVDLLRSCLDGLLHRTDYPALDVIIVDNGSREAETHAYLAELATDPRVRVLPFDQPFNHSAINNKAAAAAKGDVLGLINNDIQVIDPGWLTEMVSHALRPGVGAVGAKLFFADGRVQHAGVITGIHGIANHIHKFAARDDVGYVGRLKLVQEFSCVTAACMVLRKSAFDAVGGFDAINLRVSYNDVDLCLRLREAGYRVVWTPHAELYHLESASRGSDMDADRQHAFQREVDYMKQRWAGALAHDPFYNPNLTLNDVNYDLAFPPRVTRPWVVQAATGGVK